MPGVFPVAVTTETIVRVVRESLDNSIRLCGCPPTHTHVSCRVRVACVRVGWVGLVVDRIVDARVCFCPPPNSLTVPLARLSMVVVVGVVVCVGLLVPVSSNRYRSSTSGLSTQWSAGGLSRSRSPLWRPCLEDGFPLRCFQRLPVPNVANQPCPGRDNWHTRGSSVPVLSY